MRSPGAACCLTALRPTPRECGHCDLEHCTAGKWRGRTATRPEKSAHRGANRQKRLRSPVKKADAETLNDAGQRKCQVVRPFGVGTPAAPKQMSFYTPILTLLHFTNLQLPPLRGPRASVCTPKCVVIGYHIPLSKSQRGDRTMSGRYLLRKQKTPSHPRCPNSVKSSGLWQSAHLSSRLRPVTFPPH
jgi:hypothetical protein